MLRCRPLRGWTGEVRHSGHSRCYVECTCSDMTVCVFIHEHRAPVLVALALIESGMKYEDAIQLIRQ